MPELVLPGVYIEVRGEALIAAGPISVGNIGIVGTARKGPIDEVTLLSGFNEARDVFGTYDDFANPEVSGSPVTLVRALEQAYANGAATVYAVRVAAAGAANAEATVAGAAGDAAILTAKGPAGSAGNSITYEVNSDVAPVVTIRSGSTVEEYTVANGEDLVDQVNVGSALVTGSDGTAEVPSATTGPVNLAGGLSGAGAGGAEYKLGLEKLLNEDAHIIVAAGLDDTVIGDELKSHVEDASDDNTKRDRIAVVGSRAIGANESASAFASDIIADLGAVGDRVIFVAPGIKTTDAASGKDVVLPGSYAAAAVAGMLSARDPHVSLTNKTLSVAGLEVKFNAGQLQQLVKGNVLALEARRGFRVVKAITTDPGAFSQITTRRIVDYAKAGVRSSAGPYIGLLNNVRVRNALKGSINGFLAAMVNDEMLVSYELDVTATREEEIRGIARVLMTVRPTFSLDYIQVTMYLG